MKKRIWLFGVSCACLFGSCAKQSYYFITVKNNSQKNISFSYSTKYPDTSIVHEYPTNYMKPGESYAQLTSIKFNTGHPYKGIVEVFIFDADIFKTNNIDTVVSKYLILKRYDLIFDSTQKTGAVITYP